MEILLVVSIAVTAFLGGIVFSEARIYRLLDKHKVFDAVAEVNKNKDK